MTRHLENPPSGESLPAHRMKPATSLRQWALWVGLFVALVTVEWTVVQGLTIPIRPVTRHALLIPLIRACFNGLWAFWLVLLIPRFWALMTVHVIADLGAVGLMAYSNYFKKPLVSINPFLQAKETYLAIPYAISIVPGYVYGILILLLGIKAGLLWKAQAYTPDGRVRWKGVGVVVLIGALLFAGLQATSYAMHRMQMTPFSRSVYAYGYVLAWLGNTVTQPNSRGLLEQAQVDFDRVPDRALVERENPVEIGPRLVIFQVESLGFKILDHRVGNQEITPFLNRLKNRSLLYRVRAFHGHATADMDFACLAGGGPSTRQMNYLLPQFEYSRSLPRFLKSYGYQTAAYHGNSGEFFNRRTAFEKMGFDRLIFKEDFTESGTAASYWGVRDRVVLARLAADVASATGRVFAFTITLDSHGPYNLIKPEEAQLFPGSSDLTESYFNSIHWVDRVLEECYEALPPGTTLLFYGDHTANLKTRKFESDRTLEAEYVPVLLHRKGEDWSSRQKEREWGGTTEELTLLDVMTYVRSCLSKELDREEPGHDPR